MRQYDQSEGWYCSDSLWKKFNHEHIRCFRFDTDSKRKLRILRLKLLDYAWRARFWYNPKWQWVHNFLLLSRDSRIHIPASRCRVPVWSDTRKLGRQLSLPTLAAYQTTRIHAALPIRSGPWRSIRNLADLGRQRPTSPKDLFLLWILQRWKVLAVSLWGVWTHCQRSQLRKLCYSRWRNPRR